MSKRNLVYSFKGIINHCAENVVRLLDAQDENAKVKEESKFNKEKA